MNDRSYDFKKTIRTYLAILLTYATILGIFLLALLLIGLALNTQSLLLILAIPLYAILQVILPYVLPLALAYIASRINKEKLEASRVLSIFQLRSLPTNVLSLFLRWIALSVLGVPFGILLVLFTPSLIDQYEIFRGGLPVVVLFWFLAFLPAMVVATLLSMVPHLIADPEFDQVKNNAIKNSIKMIKAYFLRIFALRLVFLVWFVALGVMVPFYYLELYGELVGGNDQVFSTGVQDVFEVAVLVTVLVIIPLYQLMHGVIYTKLKPDPSPQD